MNPVARFASALGGLGAIVLLAAVRPAFADPSSLPIFVPLENRGTISAERMGTHDANNIRTRFWNFGMVGDYPSDPANVDLSIFHSMEVPKGSGMNYGDGVTPFVLERYHPFNTITRTSDTTSWNYQMETGYRERQAFDPYNRMLRFEPRPGYFQSDPLVNKGRSPAMSNDPRTWPDEWPDRVHDPDDPGWKGSWDGYFGKRPAADQESFTVMDDQFYSTMPFRCDSTDSTRRGLGVRVDVRGFQWSNPQAGNVIFWHYDITNESTISYDDIIFGLYMDSGVGGEALSCDHVYESDDDNAFFDKSFGLNLVYTWDTFGHGVDLSGTCERTGYLGYAYLETPGNPTDSLDNDDDGITDERREGGPGVLITDPVAIRAYVETHYDTTKFYRTYGRLENRPAYRNNYWWTGDEDMDWSVLTDDVGADGVPDTHDTGEGDGVPTDGEPNFDKTDLHESDQIGLTGFRMNRISRGPGNQDPHPPDGITFANVDQRDWPQELYNMWTGRSVAGRFDDAVAANWNIGFLFASGPFKLASGQHERFSLALAYGPTLPELRDAVHTVQLIYNANYQFAVPPKTPTVTAEAGDRSVRLTWDDVAERSIDPVTHEQDFEGYRIYRSTDPEFRDTKVITNGQGTQPLSYGQPIEQMDLDNSIAGYSRLAVDGVKYWLGTNTGIRHSWVDTTVTNGQQYYYAVCSYDYGRDTGVDSTSIFPSESPVSINRSLRGGLILPTNAVVVRPNPHVDGWTAASVSPTVHGAGSGKGTVGVQVMNSNDVQDGHLLAIEFVAPPESVSAVTYLLRDSTAHSTLLEFGRDFAGAGVGPIAGGVLPLVTAPNYVVAVDSTTSDWNAGHATNAVIRVNYQYIPTLSPNLVRPLYPNDFTVTFDDAVVDTGISIRRPPLLSEIKPARFHVVAHTPSGDVPMKFRFRDIDNDGTLSTVNDFIEPVTYGAIDTFAAQPTWRLTLDPASVAGLVKPRLGDSYDVRIKTTFTTKDTFTFVATGQGVNAAATAAAWNQKPYVVPNPYVAAASFEPQRYASSGRGERRIEFRAIPQGATIRVYTVRGDLVQTLHQDGSLNGFVPWDLRTKDNLDLAPGLYVFHVDAPGLGRFTKYIGKFAVIK